MRKNLAVSIIFVLLLTACSSQMGSTNDTHSSSASQSSDLPSEASVDWITVSDEQFGLSFSHPPAWGKWSITQIPSQPNTHALAEMSFTELDRTIQYPQVGNADINVTLRRYDNGTYRYEEVCDNERSVNWCDTMKRQDLLEEKSAFVTNAKQNIGGVPATIRDFYDVPSGYLAREVQLYTPTHRAHFSAIYDIGDFLSKQGPSDASLYDTAKKILGPELSDPINRLSTMYPEELREMTKFYQDIDRVLESMKVRE